MFSTDRISLLLGVAAIVVTLGKVDQRLVDPHEYWPSGQDSCVSVAGQDSCGDRSVGVLNRGLLAAPSGGSGAA